MIVHIALFKFKEGVSGEKIKDILKKVQALKQKCPGISDIYCGKNYHKESKNLEYGVVVLAQDQKALDNYRINPFHKEVAKMLEEIEEDGLGFDFMSV